MFGKVFSQTYKVEGIDSLDPLYLEKIQILQSSGRSPVSLDATLTNLKITGISQGQILNHTANLQKMQWTTVFKIPKLRLESDYQMKVWMKTLTFAGIE
jgi:hypothetical protein